LVAARPNFDESMMGAGIEGTLPTGHTPSKVRRAAACFAG
jgi:hypothetical protein